MTIPTDPQLGNQWHLRAVNLYWTGPGNPSVWDDYTGRGVNVGVYDNGVQAGHPDLDDNYNADLNYTGPGAFANNAPQSVGHHGTSVAGVIAAEANGVDTVGVAYNARITGVTTWTANNSNWSDAFFTGLMAHQANFDIVNHSWGSSAFGWGPTGTWYQIVSAQMQAAAANGRDGLGTIMVSAAGNDRHGEQNGDRSDVNVNAAHVGSRFSITVAGVGQDGFVANYSTPGANILVSAPTQGLWTGAPAGSGLLATDKTDDATPGFQEGADGFAVGNTVSLRGTSFAAPVVSGIVALMLEANPELGWRDVKEILAASARLTGTPPGQLGGANAEFHEWFENGARDWNGGGHFFSEDYGFGLVDARAAVRLAETWHHQHTSANEVGPGAAWSKSTPDVIPDNNAAGLAYTFSFGANTDIESVVFELGLVHGRASDLRIIMGSPSGTEVTLLSMVGGTSSVNQLRLTTNAFLGENSEGTWTIRIIDHVAGVTGTIGSMSVGLFGSTESNNDTFIYTDSYAQVTANNIHRTYLNGNDGRDLLNAAAVTGNSVIDLRGISTGGSNSSLGGAVLRIIGGIEDVVTGDGDDVLIGNDAGNWLRGMRGDDQINGGKGRDRMEGGAGADRLYGGDGGDRILGEAGSDVITGDKGADLLNGGFRNYLDSRGSDGSDIIGGGGGNDTIIASLETDHVDGGAGKDLLSFAWTSQGVTADMSEGKATFRANGSWTLPDGLGGGGWSRLNTTNFQAIEDLAGGSGKDLLSGNGKANNLTGNAGADTLNGRGGDDILLGNVGNDRLIGAGGNDTLSGGADNDRMLGGDGNDRLIGGPGADTMTGGAGADTFYYLALSDSTPAQRDRIADFKRADGDKIDLRNIDAIAATAADDAFTFIGSKTFSGKAGELRIAVSTNTVVSGDVNGDGTADFQILVVGLPGLVAGDFLL